MHTKRFIDPKNAVTHFHLKEGDVVGDFGVGAAFFTPVLAEAVGNSGRVVACEIQRGLVETLGEYVNTNGIFNVDIFWCDVEEVGGVPLEDGVLDAGVLSNTLFQFEAPDVALQEIKRTLRCGGTLFVIDWSESFAGLGPRDSEIVTKGEASDLLETAGFTIEREFDAGDHHYGIACKKP